MDGRVGGWAKKGIPVIGDVSALYHKARDDAVEGRVFERHA